MKKFTLLLLAITIIGSYTLTAQVSVNTDGSSPDGSAMLDVKSANMGLLPPRVTDVGAIISPTEGLMVYDMSTHCLRYYNGTQWSDCVGFYNKLFTCGDIIIDSRDGQSYTTVQIGTQCWMAENLNIGTRIDGSGDQTQNTPTEIIEKYCYDNTEDSCGIYGGLYQWAEMVQYENGATNTTSWDPVPTGNVQGICPTGWHIPTDAEWKTMEMYLGMTQEEADNSGLRGTDEGGKMKEAGTAHWDSPNTGATNSSGFTALPGGYRYSNGSFYYLGGIGYWYSSSENGPGAQNRRLSDDSDQVARYNFSKVSGYSVRCLKN